MPSFASQIIPHLRIHLPSSGLSLLKPNTTIYLDSIAARVSGQPTPVCPGLRKGTKGTDVWWHVDPKLLIPLSDQWKIAGASRQSRSGPENVHDAAEKEYYSKRILQQRWGREDQTRLHKGKWSDHDFIQHLIFIQESMRKTR